VPVTKKKLLELMPLLFCISLNKIEFRMFFIVQSFVHQSFVKNKQCVFTHIVTFVVHNELNEKQTFVETNHDHSQFVDNFYF
jgi:hypothetical protein